MPNPLYILQIVVFFGLTIAVHEFGHFLAAKLSGVRVDKFALGFGPAMLKFTRGETEYSLRIIPLGGFVSMPGETLASDGADDPRALVRQPPHRRAFIFSSGVVMNIILAVVLFAIAFPLGVEQTAPYVGIVLPDYPAEIGGLKPGDHIIELNGREIQSFEDIIYEVAARNPGTPFTIVVERTSEDGTVRRVELKDIRSRRTELVPILGIGQQTATLFEDIEQGSEAWNIGIRPGDRIVAIDAVRVDYWEVADTILEEKGTTPFTITVLREDEEVELPVKPAELTKFTLGFRMPVRVEEVSADSPAEKVGIEAGDIISGVDETAWPVMKEIVNTTRAAGDKGISLRVIRDGKELVFNVVPKILPETTRPKVGIRMGLVSNMFGHIADSGPAEIAGLKSQDVIVSVNGKEVDSMMPVWMSFDELPEMPMKLVVERGGKPIEIVLKADKTPIERVTLAGRTLSGPIQITLRALNPAKAVEMGVGRTWRWIKHSYLNIKQMISGNVSTKMVSGPVMIARVAYTLAKKGPATLLWFFAVINVCIAVFNFIPLPVLDGGHMLFLLVEKIRGSPVSQRVQAVATVIGLAAILTIFLAVTYKDIMMLLG